ncbi:uncharacterized protein LOC143416649 [Maylandia zebra]|uniref:uncharacterized protein LOC143416649 n=1 Tax=Maylandia zebra TaxID=106582 RepID=UPI00403D1626
MDQCEDREEGVPPSKSTLCGEHESQTKAQRNQPGPPPSSVSCKSVGAETGSTDCEGQQGSPAERIGGSPAGPGPGAKAGVEYLPGSGAGCAAEAKFEPETSCLSLKSDSSKEPPLKFNNQYTSALER